MPTDDYYDYDADEGECEAFDEFTGGVSYGEPDFADPGGRSALRAATRDNPRDLPCPTCGEPNVLTPADRALGYQCDLCADRDEGRSW